MSAIKKLTDYKSKVSSHYFIKNNGQILIWFQIYMKLGMQENQIGKILNLLNKYSIGIEIHNSGHENGYKKFTLKAN